MSKLSYEQRISIYNERKQGTSISTLSKKYNVRKKRNSIYGVFDK